VSLALAAACVGSLVFAFAFAFTAHADPTPTIYYACVNLSTGSILMTTETGTCKKGMTKISWNQVGPQGPAGKGGFIADLQGADLSNADLRYRDWAGVDLTSANLTHATLAHANLTSANLAHATL